MDHLSQLSPDLFIQQITYLPFEEVIVLCTSNKTLHSYCTDPRYSNKWKRLIDTTFGNIHNYSEILNQIQSDLNPENPSNIYNYLVYTQLVKKLDPLTQLMIYYRQKDMKSFDKFPRYQQYLALFLLGEKDAMMNYFLETEDQEDKTRYLGYIELMDKKPIPQRVLDSMTLEMIRNGNLQGVIMLEKLGGNIHSNANSGVYEAAMNGYLEVVKYLVRKGARVDALNGAPLSEAVKNGYLEVVKFLVENGANVHIWQDEPLKEAAKNGYTEIVQYLLSKESYSFHSMSTAYKNAYDNEHFTTAEIIDNKQKEQMKRIEQMEQPEQNN